MANANFNITISDKDLELFLKGYLVEATDENKNKMVKVINEVNNDEEAVTFAKNEFKEMLMCEVMFRAFNK